MSILNIPFVERMRRNHALEHATVHVLAEHHPGAGMVGRSTPNGYYIYGSVTTAQVTIAAQEALKRLQGGERHLAIHPGCGTNLMTSGMLAGMGTFFAMGGRTKRWDWERLPMALIGAIVGLIFAQPLGPIVQQRITTSTDLADLVITEVKDVSRGKLAIHKVETRS
jgi:hypothetical protein